MDWQSVPVPQVLEKLGMDVEHGLSAGEVRSRLERSDPHVLDRPPRKPEGGLFADGTGLSVVLNGPLIAVVTLAAYRRGWR